MGFSDYANKIVRSNRKLVRGITSRYYKKNTSVPQHLNYKRQTISEENLRNSAIKKRKNTIKQLSIPLLCTIILTVIVYLAFDHYLGKIHSERNTILKEIRMDTKNKERFTEYKYRLRNAEDFLKGKNIIEAQNEFSTALKLYPNSKAANIGLTKSLVYNCKVNNKQCVIALEYLNNLKQSGKLNEMEILSLGEI